MIFLEYVLSSLAIILAAFMMVELKINLYMAGSLLLLILAGEYIPFLWLIDIVNQKWVKRCWSASQIIQVVPLVIWGFSTFKKLDDTIIYFVVITSWFGFKWFVIDRFMKQ